MKYLADSKTSNMIDKISTEEFGIPSVVLMERASLACADVISSDVRPCRVLVVSGTGNNGGDAVAAGRILHERGFDVSMYVCGDTEKFSALASLQYDIALKSGVRLVYVPDFNGYDIVIDGLFGVGLNRNIEGGYADIIDRINDWSHPSAISGGKVYSIDIPSGINASTGNVMGHSIRAYKTITFGLLKTGLLLYPGNEYAGDIVVADIGFPARAVERAVKRADITEFTYDTSDISLLPGRKKLSNKGTYGKVLVAAGSPGMCGAAYMSAKAAYRSGCGLVRILTCKENIPVLQEQLPEAIISAYDGDTRGEEGYIDIECLKECIGWADAIAIGPGIGMSPVSRAILYNVLLKAACPVVADADALNIISEDENAAKLYTDSASRMIITPHLKEMTRLTGDEISDIRDDIVEYANNYVKGNLLESLECDEKKCGKEDASGIILVLKDARTVVTNGRCAYINSTGNNGMATGGSGDVLTGIIASYLAQGADRFTAASCGVYVHGLAGDIAAKRYNKHALMAGDIIDALDAIDYMEG